MRDGSGHQTREQRPRGRAAEAREKHATREAKKHLDSLFALGKGGAEGARLAKAVREAHGTPELAEACRAYRDGVGMPEDAALLSLFLDARDRRLVVEALRVLAAGRESGGLEISRGMGTQLEILAQDSDDEIAETAEELLQSL